VANFPHWRARLFKHGYRQFPADRRKVFEKNLQRIPGPEVIEQGLDRNAYQPKQAFRC